MAALLATFPPSSSPARAHNIIQAISGDGGISVFHDCQKLAVDADLDYALGATVAGLNRAAIEQCNHFAVHSGVVGWPDGTVALPAVSGGGKTTLTGALVAHGFEYVSDEALVLDDDGSVVPYPKPLSLSPWSSGVLGVEATEPERLITAELLGGRARTTTEPLTDVVLGEFGAERLTLEALPRSRAVGALIEYSFNHFKDPGRAYRLATDVARRVRVWNLSYDDPREAADALANRLL